MNIAAIIKRIARGIYRRVIHHHDCSKYISRISRNAPWVLIAYIPDVYFHQRDMAYFNSHQVRREALVMAPIFNRLGYNVYIRNYEYSGYLPNYNFQMIFGHPPLIERAAQQFPNAKLVMYATGCLYTHQNKQIIEITNSVNQRYGLSIPYSRIVPPYECHNTSDKILLIGSRYTIESFPSDIRPKITIIHQSSQVKREQTTIDYATENEYFYMGAEGNLLKGVSLLVEFFSKHPDKIINIIGPIEEYLTAIKDSLPPNIILHGWLDINSEKYLSILSRCNFIIYPSGSEAGPPGAVINAMYDGLIPIVSRWAAFDEINNYGYLMNNWDVESIEEGVQWADSLGHGEILTRKINCSCFARKTYNIDRFSKEFETFFYDVISGHSSKQ